MAAEKITEVPLESIRLLEAKGRTVAAEPVSTYVQVVLEVLVCVRTMTLGFVALTLAERGIQSHVMKLKTATSAKLLLKNMLHF